jgi:soluble lytic murein transglycosylase-like protein
MRFELTLAVISAALPRPQTVHAQMVKHIDTVGRAVCANDPKLNPPSDFHQLTPAIPRRPVQPSARAFRARAPERAAKPAAQQLPAIPAGQPIHRMIGSTARSNRLDARMIQAVVHAQSDGNPLAVSWKGAQGLMQLTPQAAQGLGVANAFDPSKKLDAGVRHLRRLLDRYHRDLEKSLAVYGADERTVDRSGSAPDIPETQSYVRRIADSNFGTNSIPLAAQTSETSRSIRRELDPLGRMVFTNE